MAAVAVTTSLTGRGPLGRLHHGRGDVHRRLHRGRVHHRHQGQVRDDLGRRHGTPTGNSYLAEFNPGTNVIRVEGSAGDIVDSLMFVTNDAFNHGPYGGDGGEPFVSEHEGCYLSHISGSEGDFLDSLSFHWDCPYHPSK